MFQGILWIPWRPWRFATGFDRTQRGIYDATTFTRLNVFSTNNSIYVLVMCLSIHRSSDWIFSFYTGSTSVPHGLPSLSHLSHFFEQLFLTENAYCCWPTGGKKLQMLLPVAVPKLHVTTDQGMPTLPVFWRLNLTPQFLCTVSVFPRHCYSNTLNLTGQRQLCNYFN